MTDSPRLALVAVSLLLSACQSLKSLGEFRSDVVIRESPGVVDLLAQLHKQSQKPSSSLPDPEYQLALDDAFKNFNEEWGDKALLQRNHILDSIILASDQSCEKFKADLLHRQARDNFILGAVGSVFGAAGAVVRAATTASAFSAAAGATSGVRAEYNQEFFSNKTAQILTNAIDKLRKGMLSEFKMAKSASMTQYSVQLAVADGVQYNGACSIAGAVAYTEQAVVQLDPGLGIKTTHASILFLKGDTAPATGSSSPDVSEAPAGAASSSGKNGTTQSPSASAASGVGAGSSPPSKKTKPPKGP